MKTITCIDQTFGNDWAAYRGDCCDAIRGLEDDSIGFSIFSPPFSSLYTYSNSERDMGNAKDDDEFFQHFGFLVGQLLRVMMPGRLVSVHCMNLPTSKARDGVIGIKDFRGDIIRCFEDRGFIYHSEVCIWKDPVTAMQRTKAIGLLHKQIVKDSCMSRQGIPDYVCTFRKPGVNPKPVAGELDHWAGDDSFKSEGRLSIDLWQRYASPVWMDINPSRTLQKGSAREEKDERHICLSKGSLVLTKECGYVPIEDLTIGQNVLTHLGRWMPIIAKAKTSDSAPLVQVNAHGVADLKVTKTHKLWARISTCKSHHKQSAAQNYPKWVEAGNLTSGNSYINHKLPPENDLGELDANEWWIIGRWLADGHIDQRGTMYISCGKHKVKEFKDRLGILAGKPQIRTALQFPVKDPGKKLRSILEGCGKGAINKRLPAQAYTLNARNSASLLEGYLSGDGHFSENRLRWYATSISKELLLGIKFLAQKVYGSIASIHKGRPAGTTVIDGRTVKTNQEWVLSFNLKGYSFSFLADDGAWLRIKSINEVEAAETWNIQVLEDSSYTAEGCIVKNCPLQLDVIERCMLLWSSPGDVVLSPFMGIGSEGYVAIQQERKFVGFELKESYYKQAVANLAGASKQSMLDLA